MGVVFLRGQDGVFNAAFGFMAFLFLDIGRAFLAAFLVEIAFLSLFVLGSLPSEEKSRSLLIRHLVLASGHLVLDTTWLNKTRRGIIRPRERSS